LVENERRESIGEKGRDKGERKKGTIVIT
jgi:hypothetical protein